MKHGDEHLHSRKVAAKFTQVFPSHVFFCRLTFPGIECVEISSSRRSIPFLERKPITILGTPSRKDCIQNLSNFLSNLTLSWSD
jgi:hypothetical protein